MATSLNSGLGSMDFFSNPIVEEGVDRNDFIDYLPLSDITETGPIDFKYAQEKINTWIYIDRDFWLN